MTEEVKHETGAQPAEAGVSLNWQMIDGDGRAVGVTMRAATVDEWPHVLEQRRKFLAAALGKWQDSPAPQLPAAVTTYRNPAGEPVTTVNGQAVPVPPPPDPGDGSEQFIDAVRILVKPEPDDKVTLEFYAQGHEYADLKASKWGTERAAELLAQANLGGVIDVRRPVDTALASAKVTPFVVRIFYKLGKEYVSKKTGKTGNYKDITRMERAA